MAKRGSEDNALLDGMLVKATEQLLQYYVEKSLKLELKLSVEHEKQSFADVGITKDGEKAENLPDDYLEIKEGYNRLKERVTELESELEKMKSEAPEATDVSNDGNNDIEYYKELLEQLKGTQAGMIQLLVVHAFDSIEILKYIFPEACFVHYAEWESFEKDVILGSLQGVYVQRQVPADILRSVMSYSASNGIKSEVFFASTIKDMIEHISYYKKMNGV